MHLEWDIINSTRCILDRIVRCTLWQGQNENMNVFPSSSATGTRNINRIAYTLGRVSVEEIRQAQNGWAQEYPLWPWRALAQNR